MGPVTKFAENNLYCWRQPGCLGDFPWDPLDRQSIRCNLMLHGRFIEWQEMSGCGFVFPVILQYHWDCLCRCISCIYFRTLQMALNFRCLSMISFLNLLFHCPLLLIPPSTHNHLFYFSFLGRSLSSLSPSSMWFCVLWLGYHGFNSQYPHLNKYIHLFVFLGLGYLTWDDFFLVPSIYLKISFHFFLISE